MPTRPTPAKRKSVPNTVVAKERNDLTAKKEIIVKERLNNGTTEMSKPNEFDDEVDEMKVVMKPDIRKKIQFMISDAGQLKFGIKTEK